MRGSLSQVFPHYVSDQNKPNAFYFSYRMSQSSSQHQPMISDHYKELKADPLLLHSFLEDEWMSVHGLPYLNTIHFHIVYREAFHLTNLISSVGKGLGHDFITKVGRRAMKHWNCSLGKFGYGQGRWGKAGNNNCLLQNWSSEGGNFGCTFWP